MGGRRGTLAVVGVMLLSGCASRSTGAAVPSATVPTAPALTTTTGPYDRPPVIDAAYVNRVLAGLDAVYGDVTRMVVSTKRIPPEALARLRAMYDDDKAVDFNLNGIQDLLAAGMPGISQSPGNQVTTVVNLITTRSTCLFASAQRDFRAVGPNGLPAFSLWVALVPLNPARDPAHYNATSWAFRYEGFPPDRTQPADPCTG